MRDSAQDIGAAIEGATAYIGLGGNLGDIRTAFDTVLKRLTEERQIAISAMSPIYKTAPVGGPAGQPDFLNAVIRVETALDPYSLLSRCLDLELQMGRVRRERCGPRTIDLDILLYGDRVIDEPGLTTPHPRLRQRLFALAPLTDIAPAGLRLPPDGKPLGVAADDAARRAGVDLKKYKADAVVKDASIGTRHLVMSSSIMSGLIP